VGLDAMQKGASPWPKTDSSMNWPGRKRKSFTLLESRKRKRKVLVSGVSSQRPVRHARSGRNTSFMPASFPDSGNNGRHMRGAQTHLNAPPASDTPNRAIPRVVLRAYLMEEAPLHPVFLFRPRIVTRGFESEGCVLTGVPQPAADPHAITAEILYAEAVTGRANHVATAAFQAPVAHLFPQNVWHATGGNASHGRGKMAGLVPKMLFRCFLKSLSLGHLVLAGFPEETLRFRYRGLSLCAPHFDEVALIEISQLDVITVAQEWPRVCANAEARWAGSCACQADDREIVGAAKIRSVRRFHLVHASQKCDSFDIATACVHKKAAAALMNRLNLVVLAVAFDLNQRISLG